MARTSKLVAAAALSLLPACGIPTEEYDARVAELRKAEERVKVCTDEIAAEKARVAEAATGIETVQGQVRDLQKVAITDDQRAIIERAAAEAAKTKDGETARKAERDRVAKVFQTEIDAGLFTVEDRRGVIRLVLPEGSVFGPSTAFYGPPGQKLPIPVIGPTGTKVLEAVARGIKSMPPRRYLIAGYMDRGTAGNPKADLYTSLDRSHKVLDHLAVKLTVPFEQLAAVGWGSADPIADDATDARVKNRRIEIELLGPFPASTLNAAAPKPATPATPTGTATAPAPKPETPPTAPVTSDDPGL